MLRATVSRIQFLLPSLSNFLKTLTNSSDVSLASLLNCSIQVDFPASMSLARKIKNNIRNEWNGLLILCTVAAPAQFGAGR